jgi:hypothetical protein
MKTSKTKRPEKHNTGFSSPLKHTVHDVRKEFKQTHQIDKVNKLRGRNGGFQRVNKIYHGDCLNIMPHFPDHSIDMVLCDLPYDTNFNGKGRAIANRCLPFSVV